MKIAFFDSVTPPRPAEGARILEILNGPDDEVLSALATYAHQLEADVASYRAIACASLEQLRRLTGQVAELRQRLSQTVQLLRRAA